MSILKSIVAIAVLSMLATPGVASLSKQTNDDVSAAAHAIADQEIIAREIAPERAVIRSQAELEGYLGADKSNLPDPLSVFTPSARSRFLRSLLFTERGLATFSYEELQDELTVSQAYEILALFGVQHSIDAVPNLRTESRLDHLILDERKARLAPMANAPN